MWRDDDSRTRESEPRALGRGSAVRPSRSRDVGDLRDVFAYGLDLPQGPSRERVQARERVVELRVSEVRILTTVGAFRVVPATDLRQTDDRQADARRGDLRHLREAGLIRTMPYVVGRTRTTLVTLTERGREVLETARREPDRQPVQAFYVGIAKPRELAHDARLYQAYLRAAQRLIERGARIRRVVLDDELKREYQHFLQASNRGRHDSTGRPDRGAHEIEQWAHRHHLPVNDGHVQFPDVRIEYDERDGRRAVEDVEVMTPHYRGAHAAAKANSGFTQYHAVGARLGGNQSTRTRGRAPFDPRVAEDFLR